MQIPWRLAIRAIRACEATQSCRFPTTCRWFCQPIRDVRHESTDTNAHQAFVFVDVVALKPTRLKIGFLRLVEAVRLVSSCFVWTDSLLCSSGSLGMLLLDFGLLKQTKKNNSNTFQEIRIIILVFTVWFWLHIRDITCVQV